MNNLLQVRQAIVDQIADCVNPVPVHTHGGRFDAAALQQIATRCPAMYLAILGIGKAVESTYGKEAIVQFGLFIVTSDVPGTSRDDSMLLLVNALMEYIPANDFKLDEVTEGASSVAGRNLYSAQIEKFKVAMWAVTWQQSIKVGGVLDTEAFEKLKVMVAMDGDHSLVTGDDEPRAESIIEFPQDQ